MSVIDKLAPFRTKRVKGNLQEWFHGEVLESIALRDKLFEKFKCRKLNIDKETYNKFPTNPVGWFCKEKRVLRKQIKRKYC